MYRCFLSGFFLLGFLQPSTQAWENCPIKIDAKFNFRVNVRYDPTPGCAGPQAPWWSYFPYDPCQTQTSTGNTYPNWPQPFPPKDDAAGKQTSRYPSWPSKTLAHSQPEPISSPANGFQLTSASRYQAMTFPAPAYVPAYTYQNFGYGR